MEDTVMYQGKAALVDRTSPITESCHRIQKTLSELDMLFDLHSDKLCQWLKPDTPVPAEPGADRLRAADMESPLRNELNHIATRCEMLVYKLSRLSDRLDV